MNLTSIYRISRLPLVLAAALCLPHFKTEAKTTQLSQRELLEIVSKPPSQPKREINHLLDYQPPISVIDPRLVGADAVVAITGLKKYEFLGTVPLHGRINSNGSESPSSLALIFYNHPNDTYQLVLKPPEIPCKLYVPAGRVNYSLEAVPAADGTIDDYLLLLRSGSGSPLAEFTIPGALVKQAAPAPENLISLNFSVADHLLPASNGRVIEIDQAAKYNLITGQGVKFLGHQHDPSKVVTWYYFAVKGNLFIVQNTNPASSTVLVDGQEPPTKIFHVDNTNSDRPVFTDGRGDKYKFRNPPK